MSSLASIAANATGLFSALRGPPSVVQILSPSGVALVQFDAMLNEAYNFQSQPTAFPIEGGGTINDHITQAPPTIDLVGCISDTPLRGAQLLVQEYLTVAVTSVLPPLGVIGASQAYSAWQSAQGSTSRAIAAYGVLRQLARGGSDSGTPQNQGVFSLQTKLGTFENLAIVNLTVPRDYDTGASLIFQMTLVQLLVVSPQVIDVQNLDRAGLAAMRQSLAEQQIDFGSEFERRKVEALGDVNESEASVEKVFAR